jgi:hypothetical protein
MSRIHRSHHVARFASAWLVGLLSLVAFGAEAHALSVSPTTLPATSGTLTITINTSTPVRLTCGSSSIVSVFTNTATGVLTAPSTIPLGSAQKNTCTLAGTGATVTQTSAWSGLLTSLSSGGSLTGLQYTITLPARGISIRTAAGCQFTLGGTLAAGLTANPATTIPFTTGALTLTVDSTNGAIACVALRVSPGLTATLVGTYSIPSLTAIP